MASTMLCFIIAVVFVASSFTEAAIVCPEYSSCRSAEISKHLKLNSSVPAWCNCDDQCHLFGDCCSDAPILARLSLSDWSFVRVATGKGRKRISYMSLMKYRCPRGAQVSDLTRQMCEQSGLGPMYEYVLPDVEQYILFDANEEFQNWHVTSRESLITYRNIYCSACNNETDVESWSQQLKCTKNEKGDTDKCTAVYHQTPPAMIVDTKSKRESLPSNVYSNCNLGWYKMNIRQETHKVLDVVRKCLILYEPVVVPPDDAKSRKTIIFKNRYCAECNGYSDSMLQCPHTAMDPTIPPSYTLITNFDTNYLNGSIIEPSLNKSCSPAEVYNPMRTSCLPLTIANRDLRVGGFASAVQLVHLNQAACTLAGLSLILLTLL